MKNRCDLDVIPEPGSWTEQPAYPEPLHSLDPIRCGVEFSCSFGATSTFYVRLKEIVEWIPSREGRGATFHPSRHRYFTVGLNTVSTTLKT